MICGFETGQYLSACIVGIVNVVYQYKLVLGGDVIEGLPNMILIHIRNLENMALKVALEGLRIIKSVLGENAGIIGPRPWHKIVYEQFNNKITRR